MVWVHLQVSKEEGLTAWFVAAAVRFHGHEHCVDLGEFLRIVEFQNPSLFGDIILKKNTQVQSLCPVGPSLSPGLKRARIPKTRLAVQIVGIENERFPFCVENTPIGFPGCSVLRNVENLS